MGGWGTRGGQGALAPPWPSVGILAVVWCAACDGSSTTPSGSAIATIRVSDEIFHVKLMTAREIQAARDAKEGGRARIPNGRIVAGTEVNAPWSWHLEDIQFADMAIEICDGRPSDVERAGVAFGGGRFCPWSATVVDVSP